MVAAVRGRGKKHYPYAAAVAAANTYVQLFQKLMRRWSSSFPLLLFIGSPHITTVCSPDNGSPLDVFLSRDAPV